MTTPRQAEAELPGLPSSELRAVLSFLLFVWLFILALTVTSYVAPSTMQARLKSAFSPVLKTLNVDLLRGDYNVTRYHLTHALPIDVDFLIEVDSRQPDGSVMTTVIPPADMHFGQRLRRYQDLANVVGNLSQNEDRAAVLLRAIGGAVILENGGTGGAIRCKAHYLQQIEDLSSAQPNRRNPYDASYYSTVLNYLLLVDHGQVEVKRELPTGEAAPPEGGRK